jgi:hypothetical protein
MVSPLKEEKILQFLSEFELVLPGKIGKVNKQKSSPHL